MIVGGTLPVALKITRLLMLDGMLMNKFGEDGEMMTLYLSKFPREMMENTFYK